MRKFIGPAVAAALFAAPAFAQDAREQARMELEQAGFTNVQILDTAFLVSATTPQGVPVTMIVNPTEGGQGGAMGGGQSGGGQSGGGQSGGGQSGGGQSGGGQSGGQGGGG